MFGRLEILAQTHRTPDSPVKRATVAIIGIIANSKINDPRLHPDTFILYNLESNHPFAGFTFLDLSFHFSALPYFSLPD
jgi:hypothetical protein